MVGSVLRFNGSNADWIPLQGFGSTAQTGFNITENSLVIQEAFMLAWFNVHTAKRRNRKQNHMKTKNIICTLLTLGLLAGFIGTATAKDKDQTKLEAKAKISKEAATKAALAKIPGGTVKECEIEKEDGKLVWSFDITTPDSKDITEVLVDANSGTVLSVEKETPEDQAKEKADDEAKEKKGKKEKDDDENEEHHEEKK